MKASTILAWMALSFFALFALPAHASETIGTIGNGTSYAWGENIGWINLAPSDGINYVGLVITDAAVSGYAWSSQYGWINFSPLSSGQQVTNTPDGQLGGYAWVAGLGWLNMSGVTINDNGQFVGTAGVQGSPVGRVSFDCTGGCNVQTDWRPLSVRTGTTTPTTGGSSGGGSSGSSGGRIGTGGQATAAMIQGLQEQLSQLLAALQAYLIQLLGQQAAPAPEAPTETTSVTPTTTLVPTTPLPSYAQTSPEPTGFPTPSSAGTTTESGSAGSFNVPQNPNLFGTSTPTATTTYTPPVPAATYPAPIATTTPPQLTNQSFWQWIIGVLTSVFRALLHLFGK